MFMTAIAVLFIVFSVAYILGLNQYKRVIDSRQDRATGDVILSTNQSEISSKSNEREGENGEKQWVSLSRDLGQVITDTTWHPALYTVEYPPDANIFIYDGSTVRWPMSQMEMFLNNAVSINSRVNSKINYHIVVGESDVDPSTCYKTTCLEVFKSIDSIENIEVASISGKIVHGKANNGGGVILPTPDTVETVILPYNKKYIVIHNIINTSLAPSETFSEILKKFKVALE